MHPYPTPHSPAPVQPVWEERVQPEGGAPGALPESQRRFRLVTPNAQSQREPARDHSQTGNSRAQGETGPRQTDARVHTQVRDRGGLAQSSGLMNTSSPHPAIRHTSSPRTLRRGCSLPAQGGRRTLDSLLTSGCPGLSSVSSTGQGGAARGILLDNWHTGTF